MHQLMCKLTELSEVLPVVLKFLRMPAGLDFVADFSGNEEIWVNEDGSAVVKRAVKS
ncbi:hypothetical protein Bsp3421_000085 (plasmid) [Burkholderia sp. FERM BP-3421]|uniref:hypothetical protein n=1 Tax=Burkholderia sp. FERM BP-3421 TaxID=1494466 RepID=UPI002360439A|nr:hypothetical protein [Burkholderia sp. FERM BP-3421]WDD90262.1 hypothetical protein Bsp3421_000085 [Burkholderia sp. FERM BP-3421]